MHGGHFSGESELDEFLASPRRNRVTLNHVRHCARCQGQVRGRRLQRLQSSVSTAEVRGEHIAEATLQAFARDQLNDGQMMQVMGHLRGCARCVGALQKVHLACAGQMRQIR
jgi:hypothetical protein